MALLVPLALVMVIVVVSGWLVVRRVKALFRPTAYVEVPQSSAPQSSPAVIEAKPMTVEAKPETVEVKPTTFEVTPATVVAKDPLNRIEGMPALVIQRLNQAGILTYADLAALRPERFYAIVAPEPPHERPDIRTTDIRNWLAQARALANGQMRITPAP